MAKDDAFKSYTIDLGDHKVGIDSLGVDNLFTSSQYSSSAKCLICGNTPSVKLIPKHTRLATAEIESKGYACDHCLRQQYINPQDYSLRKIGE